jgi:site-specific DNA-cytosine methylase
LEPKVIVGLAPERTEDKDGNRAIKYTTTDIAPSIMATQYKSDDNQPKIATWGGLQEHQTPRTDGLSPTIPAAAGMGGGHTPIIELYGLYTEDSEDFHRTHTKEMSRAKKDNKLDDGAMMSDAGDVRIRKFTPKECWRLMDFDDDDFEKCKDAGISDSQLYRAAGDSICVGVVEAIFKSMMKGHMTNENNEAEG